MRCVCGPCCGVGLRDKSWVELSRGSCHLAVGVVQILYQARVDPAKAGKKLSDDEVSAVHKWTFEVCDVACKANADSQHFPPDWLFHHRWANKAKGVKMDDGRRPRDLRP